jgi:hypothetical protein
MMVDGLCVCVSAYHWLTNNRRKGKTTIERRRRRKKTMQAYNRDLFRCLFLTLSFHWVFFSSFFFFFFLVHSYTMNVLLACNFFLSRFSHAYDSDWWSLRLLLLHRLLKLYQSTDYDYDLIDIDFDWLVFFSSYWFFFSSSLLFES